MHGLRDLVIGWYVHHHGHGHLHRALTVARHLGEPVTGLSTLERPDGWRGDWIRLPSDAPDRGTGEVADPTAGGVLHWAPLRHSGVRARAAALSAWIRAADPDVLVVDVSVEVVLLARLHGVPVVCVALPGERGDRAHREGYDASTAILAAWPPEARGMLRGVGRRVSSRVSAVGAISRFPVAHESAAAVRSRTVVAMLGSGGDDLPPGWLDRARTATPGWQWTVLGGREGRWVSHPWDTLRSAEVVVTHAGQNAVAEVAAARRPAVVVPMRRPHREQRTTAAVLRDPRWPATVVGPDDDPVWGSLLEDTAALDGSAWSVWCDGGGAARAAAVVRAVAAGRAPGRRAVSA